ETATGPSAVFTLEDLETLPAINRDIKDIIRLDPRIFIDTSFADAIQCAGANPRFNSLTVDGLRLNDSFGLNSNGYPTERIPFSFDAINQVAVELAPYDVQYGGFTACNINAVTKSGGNNFSGGAFVDYTSDALTGDTVNGDTRPTGDFDEIRYGFNVGGPIIKDKLFFFGAYEKLEGANLFGRKPEDVGITQAQFDEILSIAEGYGYISGGLPASLDVEDEKLLLKLDWNINDNHRANFTYNYNDGFNFSQSDGGSSRLADGNHFYERGAELNAYTGNLYSNWSDNLSTELSVAYVELDNRQIPVLGLENFGEVQIDVARAGGGTSTVYLGADDSRHANDLNYDLTTYRGVVNYQAGDHLLTAGIEREEFNVFNLFIQEVQGEWTFDSIQDFADGTFSDFRYENAAGTNNQNDAAAEFGYEITTFYLQDEWQFTDELTITAGLRYDTFSTDDFPALNQNFVDTFGFANNATLDGKDLLQPRIALEYDLGAGSSLRGGIGLFSGGNPNVWISNNYSNNGVTLFEYRVRGGDIDDFTYDGGNGRPFIDVPDEGIAAVANANGRGPVNALDPDFEIPSEWKISAGGTFLVDAPFGLGEDYLINLDALYSMTKEAAVVIPLDFQQVDTAPDGRPIFNRTFPNNFLLTNATDKGDALSLSASVSKEYDFGLDWAVAYAYTDATDTNPMTSSVAFSNFANYTRSNPVNIAASTSDYEIAHRFTVNANYTRAFIGDYDTQFSFFLQAREGAPFSYTFGRNGIFEGFFSTGNQLAYIPTGIDDPLISPLSDPTAVADLVAFINGDDELSDFKGSIAPRNEFKDDWFTTFDIRISQDLPGFLEGHRSSAFVVMENVGNFLNDEWGVLEQTGFPGATALYDLDGIVDGQYVIDSFNGGPRQSPVFGASLWQVRVGLSYDF
ncbi:MAG: cell envelope biogenesis protein OmpA, partial [Pseudomonadota bacterium]